MPDLHANDILALSKTAEFKHWLADLLLRIMSLDTTIGTDVARMAANECAVFDVLTEAISSLGCGDDNIKRLAIREDIAKHPAFTLPYYADGHMRDIYAGRSNLLVNLPGIGEKHKLVINAHIDTVAPHIAPSHQGNIVRGRGAVDDKGGCVAAMGTIWLLQELKNRYGICCHNEVEFQFVIEEEMGGNGSLSLTLEPTTPPDAAIVLEPTQLQIHPGGRGATWYRVEIDNCGTCFSPVEMALAAVLEIEQEGLSIRAQSDHPLFTDKSVQTNYGIIGTYGEHPSTVCDRVDLVVSGSEMHKGEKLHKYLEKALSKYTAKYGDKVRECALEKHFELADHTRGTVVSIFGISGHMGAIDQCDGAILKAAYLWNELSGDWRVELADGGMSQTTLIVEGGQGFLPCHSLLSIQTRIAEAATLGVRELLKRRCVTFDESMVMTSFDKLHNEAFACNPQAPWCQAAMRSARLMGIDMQELPSGFQVSCDARLFADAYPTAEVMTFGPGRLASAHSAEEEINLADIAQACTTLCVWILGISVSLKEHTKSAGPVRDHRENI